ncbi:MAG: Lrp/AsnC family transcriptional regulator [Bacteroidales bacterium]|jgi:Lrp/AsnC family leucine-responsive transcriptional regulator|nr:Lrp/AsnC family transcriptional regulator [Bacteroidales bacterium]
MTLDETDLKILSALQEDGSLTNKELALKVHLSPTPVFERVKKLRDEGYIKKYIAVLDVEKLDCAFMAICNIKLKQHSYENATKFMEAIQNMDEVGECYNITGDYDFQMKIYVASMKEYQQFVMKILGELDCIGGLNSSFIMGVVKNSYKVPIKNAKK